MHALNPKLKALIHHLNDGNTHSGDALGKAFGVTRAAIWKMIQQLRSMGCQIDSNKGYRLVHPIDWLDPVTIYGLLSAEAKAHTNTLSLFETINSTSDHLLKCSLEGTHVALSEHQSGGKGRRGKAWSTPLGHQIALSIKWVCETDWQHWNALHIGLGIALIDALNAAGVSLPLTLKWPNDLMLDGKKMAGILIEMRTQGESHCHLVASVGLNLYTPENIDQACIGLFDACPLIDRNLIAAKMIEHTLDTLAHWSPEHQASCCERWQTVDALEGNSIFATTSRETLSGTWKGIDAAGRCLLHDGHILHTLSSAEVSLR